MDFSELWDLIVDLCAACNGSTGAFASDIRSRAFVAISGNPEELDRLRDGWGKAGDAITEHVTNLTGEVGATMLNWDGEAADGFKSYMYELIEVLERHKTRSGDIGALLEEAKHIIEEARDQIQKLTENLWEKLVDVVIGAGMGAATGSLGGLAGTVLGGLVGAIAGILSSTLGAVFKIESIKESKLSAVDGKMDELREFIEGEKLEKLSGPPEPTIVTASSFSSDKFESDHQPPELDGVTVETESPSVHY